MPSRRGISTLFDDNTAERCSQAALLNVAYVKGGRIRLLSRHINVRSGCCSQAQAPKKIAVKCENGCLGARRGMQI